MIERNFIANSTATAFLKDGINSVQCLLGPVGTGKSSAAMIKLYCDAFQNVEPGHDGIRRTRTAILRNTYSQLETTTVKTWMDWFPPEVFGAPGGTSPLKLHIKQSGVDWEILFMALDGMGDIQRLKSLELTNAYLNEAQFTGDLGVIEQILERTNRYPSKMHGGGLAAGKRLYLDCNPPSTRHWIYTQFEKIRPEGWKLYRYAPALIKREGMWINNPDADYRSQQRDPDYWLKNAIGASEEYIRVSLCGEYGVLEEGRAVHAEYNDQLHYASRSLQYNDQIALGLGWDFGNTPACVVVQIAPDGQLVVLNEFWTERNSVRGFAEDEVIPQLDKLYPNWRKNYDSVHDPAGQSMNADGGTCQSILRELGVISEPADSNAPAFRRDALKYFLTRMPAGQSGFLLSDKCQMIREGLMGKFKYELIKSTALSGDKQYHEKPMKNMWSHICEALEYIASKYARVSKEPPPSDIKPYKIQHGNWMS